MIEFDKVYTLAECAKIVGNNNEFYFRRNIYSLRAFKHPKKPWLRAVYGIDLIRYLSTLNWGIVFLKKIGIDPNSKEVLDAYKESDKRYYMEKLKKLKETESVRLKALELTRSKIKQIEHELELLGI